MATKKVELEGAKETLELWELCAKVIQKIGEAKKQQLDTGAAVALVVSSALEPAMTALQGIDHVAEEHEKTPIDAVAAHGIGAALVAKAIAELAA